MTASQCASCPWKVGCVPDCDIPNYRRELHLGLSGTIAAPGEVNIFQAGHRIMACHYSRDGDEFACAGWLHHQLGVGNNIWLRIEVARGRMTAPIIDGPQHQRFADTLAGEE